MRFCFETIKLVSVWTCALEVPRHPNTPTLLHEKRVSSPNPHIIAVYSSWRIGQFKAEFLFGQDRRDILSVIHLLDVLVASCVLKLTMSQKLPVDQHIMSGSQHDLWLLPWLHDVSRPLLAVHDPRLILYYWHSLYHPHSLNVSAFILFNHSREFYIALAACTVEYLMEWLLCLWLKQFGLWHALGLLLVLGGQAVRSVAEFATGSNFIHMVAVDKRSEHQLMTHGIYERLRHPSYFSYFYWVVGTQMLLGNPVCCAGYTMVTWKFFSEHRV